LWETVFEKTSILLLFNDFQGKILFFAQRLASYESITPGTIRGKQFGGQRKQERKGN